MQTVNINFNPSIISCIWETINDLRKSNMSLTTFNIQQVNRIVQKNQILQQTSQEYLSDIENFS